MTTILLVHASVAVVAYALLIWDARRRARRDRADAELVRRVEGAEPPASLHPVFDLSLCLGCRTCVAACYEHEHGALVVVDGHARLGDPSACVGHGVCARACPAGGITLVYGSAGRKVTLPDLDGRFESSQRGLYVAGELGGMGLIANAARQGVEAVDNLARTLAAEGPPPPGVLPLVIVGAGPAGLAASLAAKAAGLPAVTLEQELDIGGTVRDYPRGKVVMTSPMRFPLYGPVKLRRTSKENLIELFRDIVSRGGLDLRFGVTVSGVARDGADLVVSSSAAPLRARRVLLATGLRGRARRLGVPGEDLAHVHVNLDDPETGRGRASLVVGGGDSAIEAACALAEQPGARVTLSYRQRVFSRAKRANQERLAALEAAGRLHVLRASNVHAVAVGVADVKLDDGRVEGVPADDVYVLIGRELPTALLEASGVKTREFAGDPLRR